MSVLARELQLQRILVVEHKFAALSANNDEVVADQEAGDAEIDILLALERDFLDLVDR